jgi:hypothetical protein
LGRYKSVLRAQADARAFPYHVDIPVPPLGLGGRMDIIERWLRQSLGSDWRHHGAASGRAHVARFMFRTPTDAAAFENAMKQSERSSPEHH